MRSPSRLVSTTKSSMPGATTDAAADANVSSSSNSVCSKRTSQTSDTSPSAVRAAANAISQYAAPGSAATL